MVTGAVGLGLEGGGDTEAPRPGCGWPQALAGGGLLLGGGLGLDGLLAALRLGLDPGLLGGRLLLDALLAQGSGLLLLQTAALDLELVLTLGLLGLGGVLLGLGLEALDVVESVGLLLVQGALALEALVAEGGSGEALGLALGTRFDQAVAVGLGCHRSPRGRGDALVAPPVPSCFPRQAS